MSIEYIESCKLPTPWGIFEMHGFFEQETQKEHVVLTMGDLSKSEPLLARIHSECLTGDGLFSLRCDCGAQLQAALHKIAQVGRGAVFYLRQEGRGIGLMNKIKAYHLQDAGADTVEANEALGFGADMRKYDLLKPILEHFGTKQLRLMTNNPRKIEALREIGIDVVERLPHETGRNPHNQKYLDTKKGKLGHMFEGQESDK